MLHSMTAFARIARQSSEGVVVWEIRTVNNRYLDLHFKLPEQFRLQEAHYRDKVKHYIKRGKVECFLKFQATNLVSGKFVINHSLLKELTLAIESVQSQVENTAPINPLELLRWPEVLQVVEHEKADLTSDMLALFEQALVQIQENRQREGAELTVFLYERITQLQQLLQNIEQRLPTNWQETKIKFQKRIQELTTQFDSQRLEQELAVIAQKIDVSEEIGRIHAHIKEIELALKRSEPQGRALDFLMQELNREANTLGAKCNEREIGQMTVEMKIIIDQMREQIQNIE